MMRHWLSPLSCCGLRQHVVVVAGLLVLATACSSEPERTIARSELVNVRLLREQGQRVLLLDAAPGARINARLQPVLELDDGTRVAFASDSITADSSYFTGAPRAQLTTVRAHHALLRASACPAAEQVCRSIKIDVALP